MAGKKDKSARRTPKYTDHLWPEISDTACIGYTRSYGRTARQN